MTKSLQNAFIKARKVKCRTHFIGDRSYQVVTPKGHRYIVRFEIRDGLRFGICNCAAGAADMACYHLVGAARLDSYLTGYVPVVSDADGEAELAALYGGPVSTDGLRRAA